jgi:hypothetical protein
MVEAVNWYNEQKNSLYVRVEGTWSMADLDEIVEQAAVLYNRSDCPLNIVLHFHTDFVPDFLLSRFAPFARSGVFAAESPVNQMIVVVEGSFIRAMVELMQRIYPATSRKLSLVDSLAEADAMLEPC